MNRYRKLHLELNLNNQWIKTHSNKINQTNTHTWCMHSKYVNRKCGEIHLEQRRTAIGASSAEQEQQYVTSLSHYWKNWLPMIASDSYVDKSIASKKTIFVYQMENALRERMWGGGRENDEWPDHGIKWNATQVYDRCHNINNNTFHIHMVHNTYYYYCHCTSIPKKKINKPTKMQWIFL